eukprot:1222170-Rhodomonas_salina.1
MGADPRCLPVHRAPRGSTRSKQIGNTLPLTVFDMADAFSAEVSASAPLAELLFKACLSRRALPLSEEAAGIGQPFRGLA